jgi:hypothetical protein
MSGATHAQCILLMLKRSIDQLSKEWRGSGPAGLGLVMMLMREVAYIPAALDERHAVNRALYIQLMLARMKERRSLLLKDAWTWRDLLQLPDQVCGRGTSLQSEGCIMLLDR